MAVLSPSVKHITVFSIVVNAGFLLREDSAFQADGLGLNPGSRSRLGAGSSVGQSSGLIIHWS